MSDRRVRTGHLAAAVVSGCVASSSWAGITFFIDDEAGFNAAVSGFTFEGTEDWESSNLPPNTCDVFPDPLKPRTVVVIPSLTLDADVLHKVSGAHHYEERMLCMLMLLRMPATHVIYVSSQAIDPTIID